MLFRRLQSVEASAGGDRFLIQTSVCDRFFIQTSVCDRFFSFRFRSVIGFSFGLRSVETSAGGDRFFIQTSVCDRFFIQTSVCRGFGSIEYPVYPRFAGSGWWFRHVGSSGWVCLSGLSSCFGLFVVFFIGASCPFRFLVVVFFSCWSSHRQLHVARPCLTSPASAPFILCFFFRA